MAERKKVQKIRTKRAVKPKGLKSSKAKNVKNISQKTTSIRMTSPKPKANAVTTQNTPSNSRTTASVYKKQSQIDKPIKQNRVYKKNNSFSVIRGKKGKIKKKKLITICVSFIVVFSIFIFCLTSPTGPLERITNAFELMGSGEYPAVLSGTKTLAFQTVNNKAFALTNSHLCGYTFSGKNFLQFQHNFSNPVLDLSSERVLLYNRESNKFIISNNSGILFEQNLEQSVFCADISHNGSVAFACEAASYSAQILVFDKNMEQYYTWYLADGLVSDVAVSNNGEYVAVAVLKVKNGEFYSQIYCLNTDEKEPVFVKELVGETVLKIESTSSSNFVYASDKKVSFIKWKTGEDVNKNNFSAPSYFNNISDYYLALYGEANHSDIVLYNSSGDIKHQFEFNGIIDDISIFDEKIYILSGNKVTCLDFYSTDKKLINLDSNVDFIFGSKDGFVKINNINMDFVTIKSDN